jgi:hypothetical protein
MTGAAGFCGGTGILGRTTGAIGCGGGVGREGTNCCVGTTGGRIGTDCGGVGGGTYGRGCPPPDDCIDERSDVMVRAVTFCVGAASGDSPSPVPIERPPFCHAWFGCPVCPSAITFIIRFSRSTELVALVDKNSRLRRLFFKGARVLFLVFCLGNAFE